MGVAYGNMQALLDAIERAGTLDKEEINKAIAKTDGKYMGGRVKFTEHGSPIPLIMGQWMKVDKPELFEHKIVYSVHPEIKPMAEPIFPLPPL